MDSNGRQQSPAPAPVAVPVPSSSTSTPSTSISTSTFRRLPSLARPFRRNPDKDKEKEKERIKEESIIREEEVDINTSTSTSTNGHSRTLTFPSLSLARVLGDSSSYTPTISNTNTTNRQTDESTKPTPSRTSSLPQTNDQNPPPLSPFPQKGSMREAMVSALAPPVPILSSQSMGDMEPITYPSHLAQRLPPEMGAGPSSTTSTPPPSTPAPVPAFAQGSSYSTPTLAPSWARIGRSRETTNSSINTNTTTNLITPGRNGIQDEGGHVQRRDDRIPLANLDYIGPEPGPGGPPTGVPRRKESIGMQVDHGRGQVNGDSRVDQVNGQKNSGTDTDSGDGMQRRKRATTKSAVDRPRTDTTPNDKEITTTPSSGDKSQDASTRTRKTSKPKTPLTISQPSLPSAKPMSRVAASSMYFSLLPFHGRPPTQALRAHTGTLVGNRIWMIGGVDSKHCWRGVAWYDTESLLWSTVETGGETLPPLRAHTTTAVGTKLYIFGGGDGPTYSNDVWVFDTVTHRFSKPEIDTPKQSLPPPRRAHTTVLYRNFLVIFGGGNGQTALNDIWALDISDPTRLTWEEWPTQGEAPARKGYHTANLVGDKMIVFGGSDGHASFADVHVLNLKNLQWTTVITDVKHNRLSHTSTQVGSYLFILGGHNGQSYAQDVLLFNLVTLQWESKIPKGQAPPGRGYHVALLHDARIFISGGYNGVAVFDDLWSLDLSAAAYLPQVTTFEVDETRSLGFTHDV